MRRTLAEPHRRLTTRFPTRRRLVGCLLVSCLLLPLGLRADAYQDAVDLFRRGQYEDALYNATAGREADSANEHWWRLEGQALLALGRYRDAYDRLSRGVVEVPDSLWLILLRREATHYVPDARDTPLTQGDIVRAINYAAAFRGRAATGEPDFRAAVGKAALIAGIEPKLVLENFLKPAQEGSPPSRDAFIVAGDLALAKQDPALASRTFSAGLQAFPEDPDMIAGLAASFRNSDRRQTLALAQQVLEINPRHPRARLLLAEHYIDSESYTVATGELLAILGANPEHPEALALRAVIAELQNETVAAAEFRDRALAHWTDNPAVDHLIGRKLSAKYRFKEAAAAQRRALTFDPTYVPARVELALDLLRLGQEDEGWDLAQWAHNADGYNIDAYNLTLLHDRIEGFTTVENENFRVRMSAAEAAVYGHRALNLLEQAHTDLSVRYGIALPTRTTVEIYPDPKDFGVRTFGIPDIGGYLGVCFGPVFTVNSPATSRANWEAVLWHEFAHVITLTLTNNKMPRWLSEGISVFEELRHNPAWGQHMSLAYRDRIVEERTQPISRMSAAFMEAQEPEDTMFAYYQSYLVVRYLVETHGFDALRDLLEDLGTGTAINEALALHYEPLDELDNNFAAWARQLAEGFAPGFDLREPEGVLGAVMSTPALPFQAPNLRRELANVESLVESGDWAKVRDTLQPLFDAGLYLPDDENYHFDLAAAYRELDDTAGEIAALTQIAEHEADALPAFQRLLSLAQDEEDWPAIAHWSDAWLAVNPLAPTPWRARFNAHIELDDPAIAVAAGRTLLQLDPPDRAAIHYALAQQLETDAPADARRHVLEALEEAPRFRDAYRLLHALQNPTPPAPPAPSPLPAMDAPLSP